MTLNFNIKVKSGKRTPIEVSCYSTAVNKKQLEFQHTSKMISNSQIADWIEKALKEALNKY
jgi:hypothetical protein